MTISEFINKVGFKVKDEDVKKVNKTISDIKSTATKLIGALGIGFSLASINTLIEEFASVNNGIRDAVEGLEGMNDVQQKILDGANKARVSYGSMATTVSNLVKSSPGMFPVDDAVEFTSTVTKLLKTAGRGEATISSVTEALNKSFQKGIVDTETLNVLLEQSPEAANVLAKHLGVAKSQLLDMATDGKMSLNDLKEAFLSSADEIDAAFQNVDMNVSDALLNIRNKWGLWLAETDKTLGATKSISKAMTSGFSTIISLLNKARTGVVWLSEKLGGMQNLLKLIVISAGAFFVALNGAKILDFLKSATSLVGKLQLKTLAIVAVIVLIALLIDDFINFMKGNDSVLGTLLANAGVDVDKFRESIIKIWNNIKVVLTSIWNGIKNVAIPVFRGIWNAIKTTFEAIGKIIEKVAPQFADFIDDVANGNVDPEQWERFGEAIAVIATVVLAVVAAMKIYSVVMGIVNAVMAASPITWIIAAIVALIAIIALCVKHWDKIKEAASKAWDWIKGVWSSVANWFNDKIIQPIVNFFKGLWDSIVGVFRGIIDWVKANWQSIVLFIINPFAGVFKYLYDNFEGFRNFVDGVVQSIKEFFAGLWENIKSVWGAVVGWFQGIWDGIVGAFSSVATWFTNIFSQAWEGIKNVFSGVGDFFKGIWDKIVSLFTSIGGAVSDAISGAVKGAINTVLKGAIGIINGFISAINLAISVINAIPGVSIKKLDKLEVPQLAEGGYVGANDPQAVIIGDNKNEGEIVSPISKMRDTVLDAIKLFAASARPNNS